MSKALKIWLIVATALVLVGILIFGSVMMVFNWDFSKLSTSEFETNNHKIGENFNNISVNSDTASITFLPTDDGKCRVECFENVKAKHSVTVSDGTLYINLENKRTWHDYIMNFGSAKISVYLPKTEYAELAVKNSTGSVTVPESFSFSSADISLSTGNVSFSAPTVGSLSIKTTTGKISLTDVTCDEDITLKVTTGKTVLSSVSCKNLTSDGSTGSLSLTNVLASEKLTVKRSTGNVTLEDTDAKEISIKTNTGSVKGNLLSEKIFFAESNTGRINVPKTTGGGKCEIKTDTGNINISIK